MIRAALIVLACAGGSAFADATPPVLDGKTADGFVVTSDPRGVIVPSAHAGEFYFAKQPEQGFWTPAPEDVRRFEQSAAMQLVAKELKLTVEELRKGHIRQYVGVFDKKRKWIWINFFCRSHVKDWTHEVVLVKDGGSCYLQLDFVPTRGTVEHMTVNGSG